MQGAITIVGGGSLAAAQKLEKRGLKLSHTSLDTGCTASFEMLEGKVLPAIAALDAAPGREEADDYLWGKEHDSDEWDMDYMTNNPTIY